jgi:hypothetical protein
VNGRGCDGWIRILELMIGEIRVSRLTGGMSEACRVQGPWPRSGRSEVAGNAITCRVQKRFSWLASFFSSVTKEAIVAIKSGFRRAFARDGHKVRRETLGVVNRLRLSGADTFHYRRFINTNPITHEL